MIFNLPGILLLAKKYHRVDPICELYAELFYNPEADTILLVSYFHEMAQMFLNKTKLLKDVAYGLLNEIFEEAEPSDDSIRIADCLFYNLYEAREVFI